MTDWHVGAEISMSGEGKILTCVVMGKKARLRLWTLQPFR